MPDDKIITAIMYIAQEIDSINEMFGAKRGMERYSQTQVERILSEELTQEEAEYQDSAESAKRYAQR